MRYELRATRECVLVLSGVVTASLQRSCVFSANCRVPCFFLRMPDRQQRKKRRQGCGPPAKSGMTDACTVCECVFVCVCVCVCV